MLSKKLFREALEELEIVFDGFELNDKKINIWYKYSKDWEDNDFLYRVRNCIKGCRKIPTLADILDWKNYYVNGKEEDDLKARQERLKYEKEKKDDYIHKPIPPKIKEQIHKVLNIPDRDKLKEEK